MHIHIPSVSDATDSKGNRFKVFDLYINGIYHCSLRYSQLLDLHNEIKSKYSMDSIIEFPPKILRISDVELDWRRKQLERYLHCICQDRVISESHQLINYLLMAQKASYGVLEDSSVQLEVFLCNGKSKEFQCSSLSRTSSVLLSACEAIGIEKQLTCYFGLFIECTRKSEDDWKLLSVCSDVASPYLTLRNASRSDTFKFRLTIRRWYFNTLYTKNLVDNKTCLNMLYIEGLARLEGERMNEIPSEDCDKLVAMKKSRLEFVEKFNSLPVSSEMLCTGITVGEHKKDCSAWISGKYILVSENGAGRKGSMYPISKMRCWKVGVMRTSKEHFFAFEFEHQAQKFIWVTLRGWSSIFLTQCVSKAVEEYILIANRKNPSLSIIKETATTIKTQLSPTFVRGLPPGIDIDMVIKLPPGSKIIDDSLSDESYNADQDESNNDVSTTPCDNGTDPIAAAESKKKEPTQETVTFSQATSTSTNTTTNTTTTTTTATTTTNSTSTTSTGQASYKKKPKKSNKQNIVFNTTFLDDSDL